MSYGYGGRQNPFDDRNEANYNEGGYGDRQYGGARYNEDEYGSSNVEMSQLNNPNAILNECREIDRQIEQIENNLRELRRLHDRSLAEADTTGSSTSRLIDNLSSDTMSMYRALTERVRKVKSSKEGQQARNQAQVGRVDRRLKQAIQEYQNVEQAFRKKTQDQMARQYRIVRPDASEAEVSAAVDDPTGNSQVFQQALMQSNRVGEARAVLSAVQDRHRALQRIEQQMIELAQLFEQLNTLIVEQDVAIRDIEQKTEMVVEDLGKGNEEIQTAVKTAAKTRKKKWICLGICVAIIVVIVIIVVVYIMISRAANGGDANNNNNGGNGDGTTNTNTGTGTNTETGGNSEPEINGENNAPTRRRRGLLQGRNVNDDLRMNIPRGLVSAVGGGSVRPIPRTRFVLPPTSVGDPEIEPLSGHYSPTNKKDKRYVVIDWTTDEKEDDKSSEK